MGPDDSEAPNCSAVSGVSGAVDDFGQFALAGGHYPTIGQDMDDIGVEDIEEPAEVGDGQHTEPPFLRCRLDPPSHCAQTVDVETGVDFIQDREPRPEDSELKGLVALALSTRQVDIEGAVEKSLVESDATCLGPQVLGNVEPIGSGLVGGNSRTSRRQ